MGNDRNKKFAILIALFSVTCLLVYFHGQPVPVTKKISLREALTGLQGYRVARYITLEDDVYNFLDLDDYIFADYVSDKGKANLFIGYYFSSDKVSAAHSPLVCFPGQGWDITPPSWNTLYIGKNEIGYAEVTATFGEEKELVFYWYQAGERTNPQVYQNKIYTIYNKLFNGDGQHAFVRITVPLTDSSRDQAEQVAHDFMRTFYPKFLTYIREQADSKDND